MPLQVPLHVAFTDVVVSESEEGCEILAVKEAEQLLLSVTVAEYAAKHRLETLDWVDPVDHKYLYGVVPPLGTT